CSTGTAILACCQACCLVLCWLCRWLYAIAAGWAPHGSRPCPARASVTLLLALTGPGLKTSVLGAQRHPGGERLHEALQEFLRPVVVQFAIVVEQLVCAAHIGFGLRHGRNVQRHQNLTQMMVCAKAAHGTGRDAD